MGESVVFVYCREEETAFIQNFINGKETPSFPSLTLEFDGRVVKLTRFAFFSRLFLDLEHQEKATAKH